MSAVVIFLLQVCIFFQAVVQTPLGHVMTQSIFVQVGQCGNQIGHRFWDLALRELNSTNEKGIYDSATSSFFINGAGDDGGYMTNISGLKARAVLVDMEEGVVSGLFKSPLKNIYDNRFLITDVSGSGNNWAVGNLYYGRRYHDDLSEAIRKSAELCDYLQCFFILHSMGGGTGSGIGTHILEILSDEFPNVFRMDTAIFPSLDDDVITSPYNTVLALHKLTELADCVMPIDNLALSNIINRIKGGIKENNLDSTKIDNSVISKTSKPFDSMNNIVANMLLNLTSSSRFEGTMNVDLNEISMNLVPFPKLHYLISAQSPLGASSCAIVPRKLDQAFSDAFTRDHQLVSVDPCRHTYLAAAILLRGKINASDLRRNIEKLQSRLKFVPWNREGWKVGHCLIPPVGFQYSLLALSNNTSIRKSFRLILDHFYKLYRRKAHLHHYENVDGFDHELFHLSANSLHDLESQYLDLEKQMELQTKLPRLEILD